MHMVVVALIPYAMLCFQLILFSKIIHTKNISIWYLKNISFYQFKSYFIYYTIPFYNTSNILTFILPYNTLK